MADGIRLGMSFAEMLHHGGVARGQFPQAGNSPGRQKAWIDACMRIHAESGHTFLRDTGDERWVQVRESRSPSGHLVGIRTDITALKRAETLIRRQAEREPAHRARQPQGIGKTAGCRDARASQGWQLRCIVLPRSR